MLDRSWVRVRFLVAVDASLTGRKVGPSGLELVERRGAGGAGGGGSVAWQWKGSAYIWCQVVLRLAQIQGLVPLKAVAMVISAPVQRRVVVVRCVPTQLVVVH